MPSSNILIAGLGNPGAKYAKTRHNVGFMALDCLANALDSSFSMDKKFSAESAKVSYDSANLYLLKPQTFMNASGEAIAPFVKYHNITHTLVIHDELDLGFGALRCKFGGSSGGHNGLKSIDNNMGNGYFRLRVGIGRDKEKNAVDFVLSDFSALELAKLESVINDVKVAALGFCYCMLESSTIETSAIVAYMQGHFAKKPLDSTQNLKA